MLIAIASAHAETVVAPRDLGELPRATFDWLEGNPTLTNHPTGDLLFTEREEPPRIEARDLRGRRRWATTIAGGERLVASAFGSGLVAVATNRSVSALEPRSGRGRWQWRPDKGSIIGEIRAQAGTFIVREDLPPESNGFRDSRAFVQLDARDGRVRWRTPCPEKLCSFLEDADDSMLLALPGGFLRIDAATGAPGPRIEAEVVGSDGDMVFSARQAASGARGRELVAHAASGRTLWTAALDPGHLGEIGVARAGDAVVVLTQGRLDLLDSASGVTRRTLKLPDVADFERRLAPLGDGRVFAIVRTSDQRDTALQLLLVVDPTAKIPVSFWSFPETLGEAFVLSGSFASLGHPLVAGGTGIGRLRSKPDPAPRDGRRLAEEVDERLFYLKKGPSPMDMNVLRRLDRTAYEGATIARLDTARGGELDRLLELLATPPMTNATRDALSRALERALSGDVRAQLHVVLSLLEALPGTLPEAPIRKVAEAIATNLRLKEATGFTARFLDLLWRAPYPDLDAPLRAAVAAVGVTTTGRADCPPRKAALTETEQIWADLAWQLFGPRISNEPILLVVPAGSRALECLDVSTLGKPVILGSEKVLSGIKSGKPAIALHYISSSVLSPEAKAALERLDPAARAALGGAPLREAEWSFHIAPLNGGGRRALVARVAGRWVVVTRFVRWVS
jgi:hypothetical protein